MPSLSDVVPIEPAPDVGRRCQGGCPLVRDCLSDEVMRRFGCDDFLYTHESWNASLLCAGGRDAIVSGPIFLYSLEAWYTSGDSFILVSQMPLALLILFLSFPVF